MIYHIGEHILNLNNPESLVEEALMHSLIKDLIHLQFIQSAHASYSGRLLDSLLEAAIRGRFGFDITSGAEMTAEEQLTTSKGCNLVVSVEPQREAEFIDFMREKHFPFAVLGHVTKDELRVDDISYGFISDIRKIYFNSLAERMNRE